MRATIGSAVARLKHLKPVRVIVLFSEKRGALLAGGLSYQSIFAVFAALWVGFSIAGLFLQAQPALRDAFFGLIGQAVPGLIDTGQGGAINPRTLLRTDTLSWTGAIALAGLLFTALGWLSSCRDAVRAIFDLPGEGRNFFVLKLKDLGLAIAFGAALIVSSLLSVVSTQALGAAFDLAGVSEHSAFAALAIRVSGLVLMLVLDTAVLAALFRLLSGLAIPIRQLIVGSLLGAIFLGVLKVLGTSLLGGASRNPLLASFAVIIGLLIWFNLVCQVILLSGAWIAVSVSDKGIELDPRITAARLEQERADAAAAAAAAALAEQERPWVKRAFGRLFERRNSPGGGGRS
jgi:membrane protein